MEDITNILPMDETPDEGRPAGYSPGEDARAFDRREAEAAFAKDAAEGLKSFSSQEKLNDYVNQLNKKLRHQLGAKKEVKGKRAIKHLGWIIFAVVLILVLCVLGWVVIHMVERAAHP